MIARQPFYVATCDGDKCGENFSADGDSYYVDPDKDSMIDVMKEAGWTFEGRKCYCEDCSEKRGK